MVHAKIENHLLILFMREPLETYKRVKRGHHWEGGDAEAMQNFGERSRVVN